MITGRRRASRTPFDVRIGRTPVGRGVFVTRPFAADEEILVFTGAEIDFLATLAKGERECDAFQIGVDRYLDLEPPGVFLNHSCDPNTGIRDNVRLVALRDLGAGEEIRFDYSTTLDEDHWELDCCCGALNCRGRVRDFRWLPTPLKLDRIHRNIVPSFLVDGELASGRLTRGEVFGLPETG